MIQRVVDNNSLPEKVIHAIRGIGGEYGVKRIVLFGSRARGDYKSVSDIDLAVYTGENFAYRGSFMSAIDDIETLLKIDVVFIDTYTDAHLLENINKEGVVVYEQL